MFCFHDGLKEFKFSDGNTIKLCGYCSRFDAHRDNVLRIENALPWEATHQNWEAVLSDLRLSMSVGEHEWLNYYGCATDVDKFAIIHTTETNIDSVYDHEWVVRQTAFQHTLSMPRKHLAFCVDCSDEIVDARGLVVRTTHGVYLPIDHECASVRVFNLYGELLEVKKK